MKSPEGKEARIEHFVQFAINGPLLSLEEMKGAYVFHVWDTLASRNMTATAGLLQVARATARRLVSVGIGVIHRREMEARRKHEELQAEMRAIDEKAKREGSLWGSFACPRCESYLTWRVRRVDHGLQEIYCRACGYISGSDKEDPEECLTTPTSSPSP